MIILKIHQALRGQRGIWRHVSKRMWRHRALLSTGKGLVLRYVRNGLARSCLQSWSKNGVELFRSTCLCVIEHRRNFNRGLYCYEPSLAMRPPSGWGQLICLLCDREFFSPGYTRVHEFVPKNWWNQLPSQRRNPSMHNHMGMTLAGILFCAWIKDRICLL